MILKFHILCPRCTPARSRTTSPRCCRRLRSRTCSTCWATSSARHHLSSSISRRTEWTPPLRIPSFVCLAPSSWPAASATFLQQRWGSTAVTPSGSWAQWWRGSEETACRYVTLMLRSFVLFSFSLGAANRFIVCLKQAVFNFHPLKS